MFKRLWNALNDLNSFSMFHNSFLIRSSTVGSCWIGHQLGVTSGSSIGVTCNIGILPIWWCRPSTLSRADRLKGRPGTDLPLPLTLMILGTRSAATFPGVNIIHQRIPHIIYIIIYIYTYIYDIGTSSFKSEIFQLQVGLFVRGSLSQFPNLFKPRFGLRSRSQTSSGCAANTPKGNFRSSGVLSFRRRSVKTWLKASQKYRFRYYPLVI